MKKVRVYFLFSAILLSFIIIYSGIFSNLENFLIAHYLRRGGKNHSDKIMLVSVKGKVFSQDKLWPWGSKWPAYLVSFLLDLKPRKLILGPDFIKSIKDFNLLSKLLENKRILIPYSEDLKSFNGLKFSGHIVFRRSKNYFYSYTKYNALNGLGFLLSRNSIGGNKGYTRKFYFLPQGNFKAISASSVALAGFLKGEEYKGIDLNSFKDKIVLLEKDGPKLGPEFSLLNSQINSKIFFVLPRGFILYLGIFIFAILYILLRHLKFRNASLIFLCFIVLTFLFQRFYFDTKGVYIELVPLLTFGFLGFLTPLLESEFESRTYRKEKKEMQIARLLKEKEILPSSVLTSDGILVNVTRYKMDKVGGDFYQFMEFNKGELGVAWGWVPGKGLERVHYIMEVVHGWRDFASIYKEPGKVVQVLNNSLFRYAEEAKYTTFVYLLYDAKKRSLKYVNAGHDPLIFADEKGNIKIIEAQGPTPLGIARDVPFQEQEIYLKKNNMLYSYSGGISNLIADIGGLKKEFLDSFRQYVNYKPEQLGDEVFHNILKFYPQKPEEEWSLLILKAME